MFLKYGVNKNTGELIFIEQIRRGKQPEIVCPYCQVPLIARKGDIKEHHWAHDGETCNAANRDSDVIALPMFDRFDLHLSGRDFAALKDFHRTKNSGIGSRFHQLISLNLVEENYHGDWALTKRGKIPFGELSLDLFNDQQQEEFTERHEYLHQKAVDERGYPDFPVYLADLRLYRAQWRRVLASSLYFLEVGHAGGVLHKIGITMRPVEERIHEIERDIFPHLGATKIKIVDAWQHRANLELYFKFRYARYQQRMGNLTEYFLFPKIGDITRDLRRVKARELDELERSVLSGGMSDIEEEIYAEEVEQRRRTGIKAGMERAAACGVVMGRPAGNTESDAAFLAKPKAQEIATLLKEGYSLRETASRARAAVNTVQKVKRLIKQGQN